MKKLFGFLLAGALLSLCSCDVAWALWDGSYGPDVAPPPPTYYPAYDPVIPYYSPGYAPGPPPVAPPAPGPDSSLPPPGT